MDIKKIQEAIAQRQAMSEQEPGPKKSGIKFYEGGNEKTPTGKTGAYNEDFDVNPEMLLNWIKEKKFTDKGNKEFQTELLSRLQAHPEYKNVIGAVEKTYGPTKAGVYDDGLFGSRTVALMSAYDEADKIAAAKKEMFGKKTYYYEDPQGNVFDFGRDEKSFKALDTKNAVQLDDQKANMYRRIMQLKNNSKKNGEGN